MGMSVLEKEPEHLPCGIGPLRIGVGAGGAAARPGMPSAVDDPLLEDHLPAAVSVESAAISMPAGDPAVLHCGLQVGHRGRVGLRDDLIPVARVHRGVLIAVEHDRRDNSLVFPST